MIIHTPWAKKTASLLSSLILLCTTTACSQETTAPTDQLLHGPFNLTTKWQTFALDKPLTVIPHIQKVKLMLPADDYEMVQVHKKSKNRYVGTSQSRFKRLADHQITRIEVILVTKQGQEYRTSYSSMGAAYHYKDIGVFRTLGFSSDSGKGKFYYPEGTEFVALKMRANTPMEIPYIQWEATSYWKAPNDTWDSVHPSEISSFDTEEPMLLVDAYEEVEAFDPADQLLEGPFKLTTEWQTITLDKPLKVTPHTQSVRFMLPIEDYEELEADMTPPSPHGFKDRFFKRLADEKIIQIEVILITQKGQEFRTTRHTIGITRNYKDIGAFRYLGFGTNKSFPVGKFYYPKGTEFVAIKVRANTPIEIPYLEWFATLYYQKPDKTWNDVDSSAIISFD